MKHDDREPMRPGRQFPRDAAQDRPGTSRPEPHPPRLLGSSMVMRRLREDLDKVAVVPFPVRIEGPTGTGKRLAAKYIHDASGRTGPYVVLPINSLSDDLAISQLSGHRRGAFTGADADSEGYFEQAHTGTLFLDEFGIASPRVQQGLLQLVEEGSLTRLGEARARPIDVRLIFATNLDLKQATAQGKFRHDLYQRMGMLVIRMPALASHREDIPELAHDILARESDRARKWVRDLSRSELDTIMGFDWPGNVRQLEHALRHFIAWERLPDDLIGDASNASALSVVLERNAGNISATAREMHVSRTTIYKRRRSIGLDPTA